MTEPEIGHEPVLLNEVLDLLNPQSGQTLIDGTLGRAGHALETGKRLGEAGLLVGLDVDPNNLAFARDRLKSLPCRLRLFEANFAQIDEVWEQFDRGPVDSVLIDLGISTNQLFDERYGLSFGTAM